jgi:hypothetical protein
VTQGPATGIRGREASLTVVASVLHLANDERIHVPPLVDAAGAAKPELSG